MPTPTPTPRPRPRPLPLPPHAHSDPHPDPDADADAHLSPPGTNLLANGSFESGAHRLAVRWSSTSASQAFAGTSAAQLDATTTTDARVEQRLTGLRPKTLYTRATHPDEWDSSPPMSGHRGSNQQATTRQDWIRTVASLCGAAAHFHNCRERNISEDLGPSRQK